MLTTEPPMERLLREVTDQATTTAHGRCFEHLVAHWLRHDPQHTDVAHVWLWDQWPDRDGPDCGIDLVAQTTTGQLWAVQAKAHAADNDVTAADIATFLAMSDQQGVFARRVLVTSAERLGGHAHRLLSAPSIPVDVYTRADLLASSAPWPAHITDLDGPPAPVDHTDPTGLVHQRRPHQAAAVSHALSAYRTGDRATVVLPCGTGKTDVGLWVAHDLGAARVAVLFPSLALLGQTLRTWRAQSAVPFDALAVCSDTTVTDAGRDQDVVVETVAQAGIAAQVTTDPAVIVDWVRQPASPARPRVVFATYHSTPALAQALESSGMSLDLTIADEAHHCAGVVSGGHALASGDLATTRRLFLTATPVITHHTRAGLLSMDDRARFGPLITTLTYADAVAAGHLADWKLVVVAVEPDVYDHVVTGQVRTLAGRRVEAGSLGLAAAVLDAARTHHLRRVVSFHRTVRRARAFARVLPDVAEALGAPLAGAVAVAGTDSARVRARALSDLDHVAPGQVRVVANARCLSEGVDVPTLDGVVVADPRHSVIDIIQMLGRVMRPAPGKTHGTILVPVMVQPGQSPDQVLGGSDFAALVAVLEAIKAYDGRLVEELDAARRTLGAGGTVTFATPTTTARSSAGAVRHLLGGRLALPADLAADEAFLSAFAAQVVDATTHRRQYGIGRLAVEHARTGATSWAQAAIDPTGYAIGRLVNDLRRDRTAGTLPADVLTAVEQAVPGFVWRAGHRSPETSRTYRPVEHMLPVLRTWVQRTGSLKASARATCDGEPIGKWLSNRVGDFRRGTLKPETLAALRAIDPQWPHAPGK